MTDKEKWVHTLIEAQLFVLEQLRNKYKSWEDLATSMLVFSDIFKTEMEHKMTYAQFKHDEGVVNLVGVALFGATVIGTERLRGRLKE